MLLALTPPHERSNYISHPHNSVFCLHVKKMIAVLMLLILKPGPVSAGWSVTFENPNPCALKGSSVQLRCSYNYSDGETVQKTAWYKGDLQNDTWKRVELSNLPSYRNRTEYVGDQQHDCGLVIHNLQDSDTGHYYFRFDTRTKGWRSRGSVYLTVTELSARVNPDRVRAGDNVTLQCITSCQFPSIVWFKDGRRVANPEFQIQAEDAGKYSCSVEGQESMLSDPVALDVQYPPVNVSVELSNDSLALGSNVTLTCSSAAHPAADSYTWYSNSVQYSNTSSSMVQVGSGQVLSLTSVEASHTGLYLCQASNGLGENNSTEMMLTVGVTVETEEINILLYVTAGVKLATIPLLTWSIIRAGRQIYRIRRAKEVNHHDYENVG